MKRLIFANVLPPAALLVVTVLVWELVVSVFRLPPYLLPGPGDVCQAAASRATELAVAVAITGSAAVCGLAASLLLGSAAALLFSQSRWIRSCCYPYAIFLQTVPIVAIAPLIVIWFGSGFASVAVIACIISLFPVITNVTTGLITIDRGLQDLFLLHGASRWQTMRKLQIPNAVPNFFTGAKTSSGLAVVGAIVGEFFVGYGTTHRGLGFVILYSGPQLKTDQLFAATIASALLGVVMFAAASLVGQAVLAKWYEPPLN